MNVEWMVDCCSGFDWIGHKLSYSPGEGRKVEKKIWGRVMLAMLPIHSEDPPYPQSWQHHIALSSQLIALWLPNLETYKHIHEMENKKVQDTSKTALYGSVLICTTNNWRQIKSDNSCIPQNEANFLTSLVRTHLYNLGTIFALLDLHLLKFVM